MSTRLLLNIVALVGALVFTRCDDRSTSPSAPGRIALDVSYGVGSSAKFSQIVTAGSVDSMVVTLSKDGAVVLTQALAKQSARWRGEVEVAPGRYLVQLAAYSSAQVRWRGTTSVGVRAGKTVTAPLNMVFINRAPVANAGSEQTVEVGQRVQLDGSGSSDPDGDPLTYSWSSPGILFSSRTSSRPSFTAPAVGTYRITLTVSDGNATSLSDEVVITVVAANGSPIARAGSEQMVEVGQRVQLDGSGSSDPDSDPLTYSWSSPGILFSGRTSSRPSFTASATGRYRITLTVSDGNTTSLSDEVVITVVAANGQPVARAGSDQTVEVGQAVQLDGSGSTDPDSDPLTYSWSSPGILFSSRTSSRPSFTTSAAGTYRITLTVSDGNATSLSDEVVITVVAANGQPVARAGSDQTVEVGQAVQLDGSGSSDSDGDPVTYSWDSPGIQLSLRSSVRPTFTVAAAGVYRITLTVHDGNTASLSDEVVITVVAANGQPVARAGLDQTVEVGQRVQLAGTGSSDPDGDPLTYSWSSPGILFSSRTSSRPSFTASSTGRYRITLTVSDGNTTSLSDEVVITVVAANGQPVARAGSDQTVEVGQSVQLDGSGSSDSDGDPVTYSWSSPGILFSSRTSSRPSFTTSATGTYRITLVVNDGSENSAPDELTVTVVDRPVERLSVDLLGSGTMEFVWIEPGTFTMGTTDDQEQLLRSKRLWASFHDSEQPAHEVTISQGFWMGENEITQGQWVAVMGTTPWSWQDDFVSNPSQPATSISFIEVQALVNRLNAGETTGRFGLPTEAEWEYACRAGTSTLWSFGDDEGELGDYAWYRDNATDAGLGYAQLVRQKRPNPWGLYDMHGNVWEWVRDGFSSYLGVPQVDPFLVGGTGLKVVRGGGFGNYDSRPRSANRYYFDPGGKSILFGARLIWTE
jgi:formylglycine-generating enzyme required for sulfatase activity